MKKYIIAIFILLAADQLAPMRSTAQHRACPMPQDGVWELITKGNDPRFVLLRCYDSSLTVIYEERLAAMPDLRKRRACRSLNRILETALAVHRKWAHG